MKEITGVTEDGSSRMSALMDERTVSTSRFYLQKGDDTVINVGGYEQKGFAPAAGAGNKEARGTRRKSEKDDRKTTQDSRNFDRADFSSLLDRDKRSQNVKSGIRVGAAADKTDGLSENAEKYLEKLKKKFGNMDFIIADYSSDEEADKLLAQGKGEYNVLISPDLLEKMAAEGSAAEEYEGLIAQSASDIDALREGLGEDSDMVKNLGVTIDANGTVSLHAKLIEGLTSGDGKDTVKANTVDEMLALLKETKESQAEKLAKIREERSKEAAADKDAEDKEVTEPDSEAAQNDSEGRRRSHSHLSVNA